MNRRDAETQRLEGSFRMDSVGLRSKSSFLGVSASLRLILLCLAITACEVPNLEAPECTASREVVKKFYSFHFGSEMASSPEIVKEREKYLTVELAAILAASGDPKTDYFTATDNYPRAFRVGECKAKSKQSTIFKVILLWRDDAKSEQREVNVETVEVGGKWLISAVS